MIERKKVMFSIKGKKIQMLDIEDCPTMANVVLMRNGLAFEYETETSDVKVSVVTIYSEIVSKEIIMDIVLKFNNKNIWN